MHSLQEQGVVWDYYKPRHTHAWNMLVISWRELDQLTDEEPLGFEIEYCWENFILRLWLYRTTVRTLRNLNVIKSATDAVLSNFDQFFQTNGNNNLKALRDMIEHFDDYAAGIGRGPATRAGDLDPWRTFTKDSYARGQFSLDRKATYEAAIKLRAEAKALSQQFIAWFNTNK